MPRLRMALALVALLFAAPVLAESAKEHATAARKAEKSKSWKKALGEWQAAYQIEPNAEYLIGMGDAYTKLGDKANAKKQYEAYMADPLALDTDVVKGKLASLDKAPADDLGLDLVAPAPKAAAPAGDFGLDLSGPPQPTKGKKGKKGKKGGGDDLGLDLAAPVAKGGGDLGLELDAAPVAKKDTKPPAGGDLGLDLAPPPTPARKEPAKVAAATSVDLGLDLAPPPSKKEPAKVAANATADLGLDQGGPPVKAGAKPGVIVATNTTPPGAAATAAKPSAVAPPATPARNEPPKTVAVVAAPPKPPTKAAPPAAVTEMQERSRVGTEASGAPRIVAYVAAGLAVGAFAVGGLYYSMASQDSSKVTSGVHPGNDATALLEQQQSHKSLALAGLAGGLVLAGIAAALFAF